MKPIRILLALAALVTASPALAADILVSTDAQVRPAEYAAKPGDSIVFAAGTYVGPRIVNLRVAAPGVMLKPAPGAKVVFNGGITFDGSAGFTVQDVEINSNDLVGVMMGGASPERLHVLRSDIHGAIVTPDLVAKKGGIGVSFGTNCNGCSLENSALHHLGAGVNGGGPASLNNSILGNEISFIAADAIHFGPRDGLLIQGNYIHDIYAAQLVHMDGIQIVGDGVAGDVGTNIVLRRNRLVRRGGIPFQGEFMSDGAFGVVTIAENVVAGGAYHGILAGPATALTLTDNYVTGDAGSLDGAKVMTPWCRAVGSPNSVISGNVCTTEGQTTIPMPTAGDFSAADAWWAKLTAPVDPRDAQIADLTAKLAAAQASAASVVTNLGLTTTRATTAETSLADALQRLAVAQLMLAADEALLARLRADLG